MHVKFGVLRERTREPALLGPQWSIVIHSTPEQQTNPLEVRLSFPIFLRTAPPLLFLPLLEWAARNTTINTTCHENIYFHPLCLMDGSDVAQEMKIQMDAKQKLRISAPANLSYRSYSSADFQKDTIAISGTPYWIGTFTSRCRPLQAKCRQHLWVQPTDSDRGRMSNNAA